MTFPQLHQVSFWFRQVYQIKEGDLSVLRRKCLSALCLAIAIPIVVTAIPIILILRALRPLVWIRFGEINCYRLGHFASVTEMDLCEGDAGLHPRRSIDIFQYGGYPICNHQLNKMWKRTLHIIPFAWPLYAANNLLPGGAAHLIPRRDDQDRHGVIPRSRQHLFFTAEEKRMGQAGLRALGVPEGAPFVCIYGRDALHKGMSPRMSSPDFDSNNDYRNSSINNLVPAAEEMVRRGYFVIRMGQTVNESLRTANPMIIDYATEGRTDFMDIFLPGRCWFFLGVGSGLNGVPRLFRRPVVFANLIPFVPRTTGSLYPGEMVIPKKLWRREERRFMTFRELLEIGHPKFRVTRDFERQGVEVIENTPEELLAVAVEMDERLKGTWQTTEEDQALQQRFWSVHESTEPTFSIHPEKSRPRIGAEFLRQNQDLLE